MTHISRKILKSHGYVVESVLGTGGEATVYKAFHEQHQDCAVKVHSLVVDSEELLPRRANDELEFAQKFINSPYVVTLRNRFWDQFLVTVWELAEGSVRELIESQMVKSFDRAKVFQLLENVSKGLDIIHSNGGAHGDIKPANLLRFEGNFTKIGDLGTSRIISSQSGTRRYTDMRSPHYSHPTEHFGDPTPGRDLFSLAIVYAELRLGRHPYGETPATQVKNLAANQPLLDGLKEDERELVEPVLLLKTKPKSAANWLRELCGPQSTHPPISPYTRALGEITEASARLETELRRRYILFNSSEKIIPRLTALIRREVAFDDKSREKPKGLVRWQLIRAVKRRNLVSHEVPEDNKLSPEEIDKAVALIRLAIEHLQRLANPSVSKKPEKGSIAKSSEKKKTHNAVDKRQKHYSIQPGEANKERTEELEDKQIKKPSSELKPESQQQPDVSADDKKSNAPEIVAAKTTQPPGWLIDYSPPAEEALRESYDDCIEKSLSEFAKAAVPILFFAFGLNYRQIKALLGLSDKGQAVQYYLWRLTRHSNEDQSVSIAQCWLAQRKHLLEHRFPSWLLKYRESGQIPKTIRDKARELFFELDLKPQQMQGRLTGMKKEEQKRIGNHLFDEVSKSGKDADSLEVKWGIAKGKYLVTTRQNKSSLKNQANDSFISKFCKLAKEESSTKQKREPDNSKPQVKNQQKLNELASATLEVLQTWPESKNSFPETSELRKEFRQKFSAKIRGIYLELLQCGLGLRVDSFCGKNSKIPIHFAPAICDLLHRFVMKHGTNAASFDECWRIALGEKLNVTRFSKLPYMTPNVVGWSGVGTKELFSSQRLAVRVSFFGTSSIENINSATNICQLTQELAVEYPDIFAAVSQKTAVERYVDSYMHANLNGNRWDEYGESAWQRAELETWTTLLNKRPDLAGRRIGAIQIPANLSEEAEEAAAQNPSLWSKLLSKTRQLFK